MGRAGSFFFKQVGFYGEGTARTLNWGWKSVYSLEIPFSGAHFGKTRSRPSLSLAFGDSGHLRLIHPFPETKDRFKLGPLGRFLVCGQRMAKTLNKLV